MTKQKKTRVSTTVKREFLQNDNLINIINNLNKEEKISETIQHYFEHHATLLPNNFLFIQLFSTEKNCLIDIILNYFTRQSFTDVENEFISNVKKLNSNIAIEDTMGINSNVYQYFLNREKLPSEQFITLEQIITIKQELTYIELFLLTQVVITLIKTMLRSKDETCANTLAKNYNQFLNDTLKLKDNNKMYLLIAEFNYNVANLNFINRLYSNALTPLKIAITTLKKSSLYYLALDKEIKTSYFTLMTLLFARTDVPQTEKNELIDITNLYTGEEKTKVITKLFNVINTYLLKIVKGYKQKPEEDGISREIDTFDLMANVDILIDLSFIFKKPEVAQKTLEDLEKEVNFIKNENNIVLPANEKCALSIFYSKKYLSLMLYDICNVGTKPKNYYTKFSGRLRNYLRSDQDEIEELRFDLNIIKLNKTNTQSWLIAFLTLFLTVAEIDKKKIYQWGQIKQDYDDNQVLINKMIEQPDISILTRKIITYFQICMNELMFGINTALSKKIKNKTSKIMHSDKLEAKRLSPLEKQAQALLSLSKTYPVQTCLTHNEDNVNIQFCFQREHSIKGAAIIALINKQLSNNVFLPITTENNYIVKCNSDLKGLNHIITVATNGKLWRSIFDSQPCRSTEDESKTTPVLSEKDIIEYKTMLEDIKFGGKINYLVADGSFAILEWNTSQRDESVFYYDLESQGKTTSVSFNFLDSMKKTLSAYFIVSKNKEIKIVPRPEKRCTQEIWKKMIANIMKNISLYEYKPALIPIEAPAKDNRRKKTAICSAVITASPVDSYCDDFKGFLKKLGKGLGIKLSQFNIEEVSIRSGRYLGFNIKINRDTAIKKITPLRLKSASINYNEFFEILKTAIKNEVSFTFIKHEEANITRFFFKISYEYLTELSKKQNTVIDTIIKECVILINQKYTDSTVEPLTGENRNNLYKFESAVHRLKYFSAEINDTPKSNLNKLDPKAPEFIPQFRK